jgi:lysozyme family protein
MGDLLGGDLMADLKISLLKTLKHEAGYVNQPSDQGGERNFGITKRTAIS